MADVTCHNDTILVACVQMLFFSTFHKTKDKVGGAQMLQSPFVFLHETHKVYQVQKKMNKVLFLKSTLRPTGYTFTE